MPKVFVDFLAQNNEIKCITKYVYFIYIDYFYGLEKKREKNRMTNLQIDLARYDKENICILALVGFYLMSLLSLLVFFLPIYP